LKAQSTPAAVLSRFCSFLRSERLGDRLLPPLLGVGLEDISRLVGPVYRDEHSWVSRFPTLDPGDLRAPTVFKIAQMPELTMQDISTAVKWEIWAAPRSDR